MVKEEPLDSFSSDSDRDPSPPSMKRGPGRPHKYPQTGSRKEASAAAAAAARPSGSTGRGKGGVRTGSVKTSGRVAGAGRGLSKHVLVLLDSPADSFAPGGGPPGFSSVPRFAPSPSLGANSDAGGSSVLPNSPANPFTVDWDNFPICVFVVLLHDYPAIKPVQRLPEALVGALPGDGYYLFELFCDGASQGPWKVIVHSRTITVGGSTERRAEMVHDWDGFTEYYDLDPGFILHFQLYRKVFYVKVFDGTLCLQRWVGKKKKGVAGTA